MFSGGAFANASIFALGIMPYISASIVMQLLGIAVPAFQKMQREGESGRTKINQYTRYLTVAILLVQGPAYLYGAVGMPFPVAFGIGFCLRQLFLPVAACSCYGWVNALQIKVSETVFHSSS
jgi:preprotein translocase subunit SecY